MVHIGEGRGGRVLLEAGPVSQADVHNAISADLSTRESVLTIFLFAGERFQWGNARRALGWTTGLRLRKGSQGYGTQSICLCARG